MMVPAFKLLILAQWKTGSDIIKFHWILSEKKGIFYTDGSPGFQQKHRWHMVMNPSDGDGMVGMWLCHHYDIFPSGGNMTYGNLLGNHHHHPNQEHDHDEPAFEGKGHNHHNCHNLNHRHILPAFEGKGLRHHNHHNRHNHHYHHNLNHLYILPAFESKGLRPRNSVNLLMSGRTNRRNWKW